MSFWGVSVKANTTKSTVIPEDCGLTLYTVALKEGTSAKFFISINGNEYFIATLVKNVFPQHKIKFNIGPGSEIVFKCVSENGGVIDITGAIIEIPEEDDFDGEEDDFDEDDVDIDDDEEDEDEEEEEEEEGEEAPKKKVEAAKKKAEAPKKKEQPPQKKAKNDDGKKFKCSACDKTFGSEQGRDAHFAAKHK